MKVRQGWVCGIMAALLGMAYATALVVTAPTIGYVRDEGAYFAASRQHAQWLRNLASNPATAVDRVTLVRHFALNREHPSVMKFAAAASALVLAKPPVRGLTSRDQGDDFGGGRWPIMDEGQAMRLPAQILAGATVAVLFALGFAAASWPGAVVAGLGFAALPHVFFHAHLHAFDVPIASATLAVALAYLALVRRPNVWRTLVLGASLGLAMGIKHNALFLPPLLVAHASGRAWLLTRKGSQSHLGWRVLAWTILACGVVAPLLAFGLWPWLWVDTLEHLREYAAFHRQHAYYNTEYFGQNYNRPPFPWSFPFVMTAATVPLAWLVLAMVGVVTVVQRDGSAWRQTPLSLPSGSGVLVAMLAIFPLALIAWPTVPIFGGTKHWFTAYPFLAWAAAYGLTRPAKIAPLLGLLTALVLVFPGFWAIARAPSLGLSHYGAAFDGARGAAELGFLRGFWGHAGVVQLLANREALELPRVANVYLHDIHPLALEQYRREGKWPQWTPTRLEDAELAFFFPELHMRSDEAKIWNAMRTVAPVAVHTLDDVPVMMLYRRAAPATLGSEQP